MMILPSSTSLIICETSLGWEKVRTLSLSPSPLTLSLSKLCLPWCHSDSALNFWWRGIMDSVTVNLNKYYHHDNKWERGIFFFVLIKEKNILSNHKLSLDKCYHDNKWERGIFFCVDNIKKYFIKSKISKYSLDE